MNPMDMITPCAAAAFGGYRTFRDDAVARRIDRLRHKEAKRRKRNALLAALVLAASVFSATTAASLLTTEAATSPSERGMCLEADRRLAPWFKAEAERKALVGLGPRDDFNLLLTWFRSAQAQCASGKTARAIGNFDAIERMITQRAGQRAPDLDEN